MPQTQAIYIEYPVLGPIQSVDLYSCAVCLFYYDCELQIRTPQVPKFCCPECFERLTITAGDRLFGACASLLTNGADANFRVHNGAPDGHLFTPLLCAAKNASLNSKKWDISN